MYYLTVLVVLLGINQDASKVMFLPGAGGESTFLPFPASRGSHSLAHVPTSSIFTASNPAPWFILSLSLTRVRNSSLLLRTHMTALGPPDNLPTSRSFTPLPWWLRMVKNLPATQETWIPSLDSEDPPKKRTATHSGILAWRILWTLQSMGLQRVILNWVNFTFTKSLLPCKVIYSQVPGITAWTPLVGRGHYSA